MTHFWVDVQLPLYYNYVENGKREKVPEEKFYQAYFDLLKIAGGIHTSNIPIMGSWISPKNKKIYHDKNILLRVLVESDDRQTVTNAKKIKKLMRYKKTLKENFQQEDIFMVATRCTWL